MVAEATAYAFLARVSQGAHMVVSPHPDDAALSLGGTLARLAGSPVRPHLSLLSVFTRSVYAPGVAAACRCEAVVSAVRRREEIAFAAALSAELHLLDLPDTSLRGYDDATERCTVLAADARVSGALESRLREIVESLRPTVCWCPLGLGCHVDHVLARDAVLAVAQPGMLRVFYEDLPYAADLDEDAVLAFVRALPVDMRAISIDVSDTWPAKLSFLGCYPSQVGPEDRAAVEQMAARRANSHGSRAERLWIVT